MNKRNGKSKIWWVILMIVIAGTAAGYGYIRHRNTNQMTYREIHVSRSSLDITILSTGTVAPENRLEIKPPIAGRVEQVLVDEGYKVKKGQVMAWMSSTERAALIDAARSKGPDELKRWEELYRPTPILAPINGTIILRNVEQGQTFTNVDSVFSMSDRLTVQAQVDETDIAQIRLKQEATIILDAYSDQKIPARVDKIAFDAKTVNNVTTYIVDVLPIKTPTYMRSGMTANVTFLGASKKDALTIPSEALRVQDNRFSVLLKSPDGTPIEKKIEIGLNNGKLVEIASGLTDGDVVLIPQIKVGSSKIGKNPFSQMGTAKGGSNRH